MSFPLCFADNATDLATVLTSMQTNLALRETELKTLQAELDSYFLRFAAVDGNHTELAKLAAEYLEKSTSVKRKKVFAATQTDDVAQIEAYMKTQAYADWLTTPMMIPVYNNLKGRTNACIFD